MKIKVKGVLDRITDGQFAVILVEENKKQYDVPIHKLPPNVKEGDWFHLLLKNDQIIHIEKNDAYTDEQAQAVASIMEKLRNKNKKK